MIPNKNATQILIARHGNTFRPGETPTRVGARTDLSLVEKAKAINIGNYLTKENFLPDIIYASPLKRTSETATIALETAGLDPQTIQFNEMFREIDYGPDENKTEAEVIERIGQNAIDEWNHSAKVPQGWIVDPDAIMTSWKNFGHRIEKQFPGKKILVVTSNGVGRFSPILCGNIPSFQKKLGNNGLKIGTGSLCLFQKIIPENIELKSPWQCIFWNKRPEA